jgi:hypothetical protein
MFPPRQRLVNGASAAGAAGNRLVSDEVGRHHRSSPQEGVAFMRKYIVYRLDGIGKIHGVEWLDALDDRFALEGAREIAGPGGCEVWQLKRKVGHVSPRA